MLRKLASKGQPGVQYGKVDLQKDSALGATYEVGTIPDTRFYHDGKEVGRFIGTMKEASIEKLVNEHLASLKPVGRLDATGMPLEQNGAMLAPVDTVLPAIRPEPARRSLPPGITPL